MANEQGSHVGVVELWSGEGRPRDLVLSFINLKFVFYEWSAKKFKISFLIFVASDYVKVYFNYYQLKLQAEWV